MTRLPIALAALASLAALVSTPLLSQETYWIANRASSDLMRISAWGSVLDRVDMGTGLRSAHRAPDGKVWVVRFIQSTFDIYDPATGTITPVPFALGSPYSIAFDSQGTAWVSGGTGVEQFAPNGLSIQTFPLPTAAPLGITIDSLGNKWIAHRTTPPAVTRIDAANTVSTFPLVGTASGFLPVGIVADFRGFFAPSRIWVTGDGPSQLVEVDELGNTLNVYSLPVASTGLAPAFDLNGNIWVGSFGNGALMQIDQNNGNLLNQYTFAPSVNGVAVDSFGRIWVTARITFSGVGPPCEVRRIDPASGTLEVPGVLEFGSFVATGTQSPLSTPFQYALVVAPFGDMDGDGIANAIEIQSGTSPIDAASTAAITLNTTGATNTGSTPALRVRMTGADFWAVYFSGGIVAPGTGLTVPGVAGEALLSPLELYSGNITGVGAAAVPIPLPVSPVLVGYEVFMQGVVISPLVLQFSNVTGLKIW